jgi:hypothetical protein
MFPYVLPLMCVLGYLHVPLSFSIFFPIRPEILRMSEFNDNPELQSHSQAVLYILSAVAPPPESIEAIGGGFVSAISSSTVCASTSEPNQWFT